MINGKSYFTIKNASDYVRMKYITFYMRLDNFNIIEVNKQKYLPEEEVEAFKRMREMSALRKQKEEERRKNEQK